MVTSDVKAFVGIAAVRATPEIVGYTNSRGGRRSDILLPGCFGVKMLKILRERIQLNADVVKASL
jgi:hypothetical protein